MTDETLVYVNASETLNGVLRFRSFNDRFDQATHTILDRWDTLDRWEHLVDLETVMRTLGLRFQFDGTAEERYALLRQIVTDTFTCRSAFFDDKQLRDFQRIGLNLATHPKVTETLLQWDTGTGKTVAGTLAAQKLLEQDRIDAVLLVATKGKHIDWERFILAYTDLRPTRINGTRKKRHRLYEEDDAEVLIVNWERLRYGMEKKDRQGEPTGEIDWGRTDLLEIARRFKGKRLLVILDEAQAIARQSSLTSRGLRALYSDVKKHRGRVIKLAMTATTYRTSPENVRVIANSLRHRFLPSKMDFETEYVERWKFNGFEDKPIWNEAKLPLLGKRMEPITHVAMKSDPVIAAQFPEMTEREILLELSDEDREVYDFVRGRAKEEWDANEDFGNEGNFNLLRMICCTTESLRFSKSPIAQEAVEKFGPKLRSSNSMKFRAVMEFLETLAEAREKVVLFTFWRNAVLEPFSAHIRNAHAMEAQLYQYVGNMKPEEAKEVEENFQELEGKAAILLCSDAAQAGLNIYAPYLAHIETPTTYLAYKQRRDRIHRMDSMAHGIERVWIYRYLTLRTVEVHVDRMFQTRERESALIQGQPHAVSDRQTLTQDDLYSAMFDENWDESLRLP